MSDLFKPPRTDAEEKLNKKLQSAEELIAKLQESLKTPYGENILKVTTGYKVSDSHCLLRKPLFEADILDTSWPGRLLHAITAAKQLGFNFFEMDLSGIPEYNKPQEENYNDSFVYFGSRPKVESKLKSPISIRVWALLLAENKELGGEIQT